MSHNQYHKHQHRVSSLYINHSEYYKKQSIRPTHGVIINQESHAKKRVFVHHWNYYFKGETDQMKHPILAYSVGYIITPSKVSRKLNNRVLVRCTLEQPQSYTNWWISPCIKQVTRLQYIIFYWRNSFRF